VNEIAGAINGIDAVAETRNEESVELWRKRVGLGRRFWDILVSVPRNVQTVW